jgi:hypothetical protein
MRTKTETDLFAGVDPARTLVMISTRYPAAPIEGTLWTGPAKKALASFYMSSK